MIRKGKGLICPSTPFITSAHIAYKFESANSCFCLIKRLKWSGKEIGLIIHYREFFSISSKSKHRSLNIMTRIELKPKMIWYDTKHA